MGREKVEDIRVGSSANLTGAVIMVGSRGPLSQGRRSVRLAAGLALLLLGSPATADRRDQKAADLYTEGVKLIRQGRYREGAEKVNSALARGATEPVEAQGTERRFLARPYDPYYWLGVAQMETGLIEQALANFEKSATIVPKGRSRPVLADSPAEWADLERRRAEILARMEAPPPTAVAVAAAEPTPTPFALRLANRAPPPTVAVAALPPPSPTPAAASPSEPAFPASALALREELAGLLADPAVAIRAAGPLRAALARFDAALRRGPDAAAAEEKALRRELESGSAAEIPRALLTSGLEAQRDRRYEEAARLARLAASLVPGAASPHLLRCAALGSAFVLGGEERPELEREAREAYTAWLSRRAADAPPSPFLSPALRQRLERPRPIPSPG